MRSFNGPFNYSHYKQPKTSWSFSSLCQTQVPPASEGGEEDEDLFEQSSNKAVGSSMTDEDGRNRMDEFQDDEGPTADVFGTPPQGITPMLDVRALQDSKAPYNTKID